MAESFDPYHKRQGAWPKQFLGRQPAMPGKATAAILFAAVVCCVAGVGASSLAQEAPKTAEWPESDFEILEATWGAGDSRIDVTSAVRAFVKDRRLAMMAWQKMFGIAPDPNGKAGRTLRIRYRSRRRTYAVEYPQFYFIHLEGHLRAPSTDSAEGVELLEARYGAGSDYLDVLAEARDRVRDGRFSAEADEFYRSYVIPDGWAAGNWANTYKVLWLRYRNATGEHFAYAWDNQRLTIESRLPETAGAAVNLLKRVDVRRDAVQGDWKFDGKSLAAPGGIDDRLQLPVNAPDEYALTVVAEADGPLREVSVGLPIGGRQVIVCLDGDKGRASGLRLAGRISLADADRNPTTPWRLVGALEQGRPNTLTYLVRKTSLRVLRDGAEVLRWSGDPQTLSLPPGWNIRDPRSVFVQCGEQPFRISKLELTPLAPAKREMLTRLEPNRPVDALQAVDLERDRVHGFWQFDGDTLISPADERGVVQIPAVLPEEYRLEFEAMRESGGDHLSFTLPLGGVQTTVVLDAHSGTLSGLQTIDGKNIRLAGQNETRYEGSLFADGDWKSIVISVRKNHVHVACQGQTIIDWTGDVRRLGPMEELPYKDRLYLGAWNSRYWISKIELTPIN